MFFFALVLNLVDLFMNIATYLQNNCSLKDMLMVMAYYVPKTIWYAVPVAILFSSSYALSEMYAANEIQALLASGVSLFRFTVPLLIVSFLMAFGLFAFENKFVVQTYDKKVALQDTLLQKQKNENNTNVIVLSQNGRIIYKASRYIESQKRLRGCYFIFRDENHALEAIIYSAQAQWDDENKVWLLEQPLQYKMVDDALQITSISKELVSELREDSPVHGHAVDIRSRYASFEMCLNVLKIFLNSYVRCLKI